MNRLLPRLWRFLMQPLDPRLLALLGAALAVGSDHPLFRHRPVAGTLERPVAELLRGACCACGWWPRSRLSKLARLAVPLYLFGILLLVAVAVNGEVVNGARRWLHVGVTRIQPSELVKLATPMMIAWYLSRHQEDLRGRHFLAGAILLAIPLALVLRQPDLGTAMLIGASGFYVLFLAGLRYRRGDRAASAGPGIAAGTVVGDARLPAQTGR
jgi:rod shape determining protein RodA